MITVLESPEIQNLFREQWKKTMKTKREEAH